MGVWYWGCVGVGRGVVQSFSLLAGDSPWAAWVHQLPCLLLHPLPVLLGPKEFCGETARYKAGSPTTSSLSRALFPSPDTKDHVAPRATRSQVPRAPQKALPRPDQPPPRPPKAPAATSGTRPATAGLSQPRRALTRRIGASRSWRPAAGWASASCRRGRRRAGVALLR